MTPQISNQAVLYAIDYACASYQQPLTSAQEWFIDLLRRCAGELSDAREGVGYIALCESTKQAVQSGWLVAQGYSKDGVAHPDYVSELAELTPYLQHAVDSLIAHGERVEVAA